MTELIVVPPVTGVYSKNIGPAITLTYAKTLSFSRGSQVFIPWNCGGRKVDNQKLRPEDIISSTNAARIQYDLVGLWPKDCIEYFEFDSSFKEIVFRASKQDSVLEKQVNQFFCSNCNKSRMLERNTILCPVCGVSCSEKTIVGEFCVWNDVDVRAAVMNLTSHQKKRMLSTNFSGYLLQVYREKLADDHWKISDKTYNQRFVASQWLRFVHERYQPDSLVLVSGSTVETKWLLPSLLMLTEDQREKTVVYSHGVARTDLTLDSIVTLRQNFCFGATRYAIAPVNIGKNFSLRKSCFEEVQKLRRKLYSCVKYLEGVNLVVDTEVLVDDFSTLPSLVNDELCRGNHANAYCRLQNFVYNLSTKVIPIIRERGISRQELGGLKQVLSYVAENLS